MESAPKLKKSNSASKMQEHAEVAQLVEQTIRNRQVAGSIPALGSKSFPERARIAKAEPASVCSSDRLAVSAQTIRSCATLLISQPSNNFAAAESSKSLTTGQDVEAFASENNRRSAAGTAPGDFARQR